MTKANAVKLKILDKEVQLSCTPGEEEALAKAAAHVDNSMRELRMRNNSSSTEKLAIVTAINNAYALIKEQTKQQTDPELSARLHTINKQLDNLLQD